MRFFEFSEPMYNDMEGFVGKRKNFSRASIVMDCNRLELPVLRHFEHSPPTPCVPPPFVVGSLAMASVHMSQTPTERTPGNDMPGNTGSKRKSSGTDNLVGFVKNVNYDSLACAEAQERDKHAWRNEVFGF